jgi:hypothetical protein
MKLLIPCGNDQHFVAVHRQEKHEHPASSLSTDCVRRSTQDFHLQILIKNLFILFVENKEAHRLFCAQYRFSVNMVVPKETKQNGTYAHIFRLA